jgi:hypothetical protein
MPYFSSSWWSTSMQVSLLFPPTWHPSQPYLNLPSLTGFLAKGSVTTVSKRDLGIELLDGTALGFLSSLELLPAIQLKGKGQALPVFRVKQ